MQRLFGVGNALLPNRIYFSKQYQPSDFTVSAEAGGYIDVLPDYGSAVDIVTFGNSIYIFWQYGVTRLKAFGYQERFCAVGLLPLLGGDTARHGSGVHGQDNICRGGQRIQL